MNDDTGENTALTPPGPAVPAVSAATLGTWLTQARDWQRQGNPGEAQAQCRPRHTEALNLLGMLLLQQGRPALAEQTIRQAIQSALGDAAAYANLGATLAAQRRYEAAVTAFSYAIRLRADDADVQIQLGDACRELGQLAEAVAAWRQASLLRPADPELHYRLGSALVEQGQAEEAIAALEITRQGNPSHHDAITLLVTLLHRQGRIVDAGQVVGSAIFDWGATAAAETLLRDWLTLTPDDPVAQHFLIAWFSKDIPPRAADAYVIRLFDQYADQFDEDLQRLQYRAPELIAEAIMAALGPPDGTLEILDAGCGTGLCGPLLRPYARYLSGVDLSPGMVDKAGQRGGYDDLAVAELTTFLAERPESCDLIASADTLVYFGDLGPVLTAAAAALRSGGWLAFTVEAVDADAAPAGFHLNRSGRYSHTADYVRQRLTLAGLTLATLDRVILRLEYDQPVAGWLVTASRSATQPDGG